MRGDNRFDLEEKVGPAPENRELQDRAVFYDHLHQALAQAQRTGELVALQYLELGELTLAEGTVGHFRSEEISRCVSNRLRPIVRRSDTLACLGGRRFAILQRAVERPEGVTALARKILAAFAIPLEIRDTEVSADADVGIAFASPGLDAGALVAQSRAALLRAREGGGRNFSYYAAPLDPELRAEVRIHEDLHRALHRGEFFLEYQPEVDLRDGRILCAEALLRWRHPTRGVLAPARFISAAEKSAFIADLGAWVVEEAARACRAWSRESFPAVPVAVNLSAVQLRNPDLPDRIFQILDRARLPPGLLELEVTESSLVETHDEAGATLDSLHGGGVRLAIDDFGTGYSSLHYLSTLPISKIKIPGSFVDRVTADRQQRAIVDAMITVAHRLGMTVVGECVETGAQRRTLRALGCDAGQGFLFGRPASKMRPVPVSVFDTDAIPPLAI